MLKVDKYKTWWYKVVDLIEKIAAGIHWQRTAAVFNNGIYYHLLEKDHDTLRATLGRRHFIILNHRSCHFTTYVIALMTLIKSGKIGYWTHAFVNTARTKFVEATAIGTHSSTFMQVFDCDGVVLLSLKGVSDDEWWEAAADTLKDDMGKPYDDLFDYMNTECLSCVEVVWTIIENLKDYRTRFPNLIAMIESEKQLTPQMYYDCPDFEKIFEVRR